MGIGGPIEVLQTACSDVSVLKVSGDVDHLTAPALEEILEETLAGGGTHLLVDLADCSYLDGGGLSVLRYGLWV